MKLLSAINKYIRKNVEVLVTIMLAIITLLLWCYTAKEIDVSDLWLNLTAGFIGSICTILVIDRTLKRQKEKETIPIRLALYRDVQLLTSRVIDLWQEMYIQCNPNRDNIPIEELFSEEQIEYIYTNLDLEGYPNVLPRRNWYKHIDECAKDFEEKGNHILDRYVLLAEPELLQAIHYLVNHSAFGKRLLLVEQVRNADNYTRAPRIPILQSYPCQPEPKDYESIKVIFSWCKDNYEKLNRYGIVYKVKDCVDIVNEHVPPQSIMSKEKFERCLEAYIMWQKSMDK